MKKKVKVKTKKMSTMVKTEDIKTEGTVMEWKPSRGQPTKYDPKYCEEIIQYFSVPPFEERNTMFGVKRVPNVLPTMAGFAFRIGISKDTLYEWKKNFPEFSDAVKRAGANQEHMLITNALLGGYNHKFSALVAANVTDMKMQPSETPVVAQIQIIKLPERYEPVIGQSVIDGTIVKTEDLATTSGETNDRPLD